MLKNFDTGYLFDSNGKKYDISVILNWPTESDWNNTDDVIGPNLIDFYFGEPDNKTSERYYDQFVERQNKLKSLLNKLYNLKIVCPDDTEIDEQIEFVKSLIIKIY
jgi:hypothetical protein